MTIRDWINNPSDFNTGLELYQKYGTRHHHVKMVANRGDTPANRQDLIYELGKLVGRDEIVPVAVLEPVSATPAKLTAYVSVQEVASSQKGKIEFPPEVEALRKEAIDKKNRASFLHHQVFTKNYESKEERAKDSNEILDLMDEVKSSWDKIDYFKEHGKLPEVPEPVAKVLSDNPIELLMRRNTLRTYISSARKGNHPRRKPEHIPAWEAEIEQIELKLNEEAK